MTAYACIATRHEAAAIGPLVRALRAQGLVVIVEDESDRADTYMAAYEAGAAVRWTPGPQRTGLGPSLMRAWRRALQEGASAIVQLDAGGSHDPAAAGRLLDKLSPGTPVIGSRFCASGRYIGNRQRLLASRLATWMCNHRLPAHLPRLTDWTSGYRAFSATTARWLLGRAYYATGHAWQIEVVLHLLRAGTRVAEAPITYTAGRSSLNWHSVKEAYNVWRMI